MGLLLVLLIVSAVFDIRNGKISNRLIIIGLCIGLTGQLAESGIRGILVFLCNISFPVISLYLLFLMRALGAGDIKLFSLIGSILTLKGLLYCMFYSFIIGAVISFVHLLLKQNMQKRFTYFFCYAKTCLYQKTILPYDCGAQGGRDNCIHFSIPVLLGYLVYMGVRIWQK